MNTYRSAAVALIACAAGLSLTACTAGVTTASSAATSPAARNSSSTSASASASASASQAAPALASRTIKVSGEFGSFPIPARAKVVENVASDPGAIVFFDQVTRAKVSSFYAQALPRAGYTITDSSVSIAGLGHKNVTTISIMPK